MIRFDFLSVHSILGFFLSDFVWLVLDYLWSSMPGGSIYGSLSNLCVMFLYSLCWIRVAYSSAMIPCLNVSTNMSLRPEWRGAVDTSTILVGASKTVASVIGKLVTVRSIPSPFLVACLAGRFMLFEAVWFWGICVLCWNGSSSICWPIYFGTCDCWHSWFSRIIVIIVWVCVMCFVSIAGW